MPNSSISTTYILKPNLQDAFWIGLFWFGAPLFPVHVYSVHWMLLLLPTLVHFSNFPFPHLRIGGLRVQGKGGSNHLQLPRGQETRHKGKWRKELGLSVKAKIGRYHVTILMMRKIMMMMLMRAREWWRILIPGTASPRFPTGENHLPAAHPQQHKHFIWQKNIGSKIFLLRDKTGTAGPYQTFMEIMFWKKREFGVKWDIFSFGIREIKWTQALSPTFWKFL